MTLVFHERIGGNQPAYQRVNAADQIIAFPTIAHHQRQIDLSRYGHSRSVGEGELLCFRFNDKDLHLGDISIFSNIIRDLPEDKRLRDFPLTRLILAERCQRFDLIPETLSQAHARLLQISPESGRAFCEDFALTRVCRVILARAAGLLERHIEEYPQLKRVRVRIHDGRAVVFIQSEEISQIRYTQRLDQAVTFGLQSYLAGFNLPAQLEFRYTDVTITAPEPERPDASDEVKIYGIGPRAEQAIAELFPRSAINRRMKSIPALSSFKTTMPYTRRGSLLPINICFIDGGGRFLEAAEALSSALPAGNTIAVINAGDLSGVNRPGVLADIYRSSFRNLAIFRHEPIWRDGMISTPNLSTLYHQFFRTFTASLLRLEAGGRSRGSTSIFTFAYMGGGIRNLEGAISRCISSGANGIYPLHQSRSGSLVVTTVARLNSAYQWQAKRAVSRNLPIREDDVEVGSWRLTSDQYGNASSVAFLSDGIGDGEYATGAVSPDEIEIVLKGCGTNYQHDNNVDRHFFRIFFDGNELALFCGNEPPSSLHLVPAIVVRDHNFIPSGARRTVNSDIEVPISALSLVLLSSDPMRMARFLDFYLYRDRPEWLFSETERLLKDRFGRLRPDQLGFRLPKRDGEISMDQLGVSFKLPSLRRNYEIAISGSCEVFVKGVMKKKRKTSVVVFRASFSLLHRPTYEPRWLKFEMGPVSEL